MSKDPDIDYSGYSTEELMDIYISLDKDKEDDQLLIRRIEHELRQKLNVPRPSYSKGFDLYEFMHMLRIGSVTGIIPGIGIAFLIFNMMKSPAGSAASSPPVQYLYVHIIVIALLAYGILKSNLIARILAVVYAMTIILYFILK